jgi:hypothetical protein
MSDQFVRVALEGCVVVEVQAAPRWAYTIGLSQSLQHPEVSGAAVVGG